MIQGRILDLVDYALATDLITEEDKVYTINRLLELFCLEELEDDKVNAHKNICKTREEAENALPEILGDMLDYAYEQEITKENGVVYRDLFDTKIMGMLLPRPSEVTKKFWELYKKSPVDATDYFYTISRDSDYIRRYRIKKDLKWTAETEYGTLDITINLSKPEKDPKAIAVPNRAAIPNAFCARKMWGTGEG
jgi:UDPglucose--hexose-1-phosphate uridylyltransferase